VTIFLVEQNACPALPAGRTAVVLVNGRVRLSGGRGGTLLAKPEIRPTTSKGGPHDE